MHKALIKCKTCSKIQEMEAENVAALLGNVLQNIECFDCRNDQSTAITQITMPNGSVIAIGELEYYSSAEDVDFSWVNDIGEENPQ